MSLSVAPNIQFGQEYFEGVSIKAGENIRLKVTITGRPTPKVTWFRDCTELTKKMVDITTITGSSTLFIRDADRSHRGVYTVEATNSLGTKKEPMKVEVFGNFFVSHPSHLFTPPEKYTFFLRSILLTYSSAVFCISDTPGEPVGPIMFSDITEGKVTLSWNPPENDGCSDIMHYIVEKRETSKISWALVTDECLKCTYTATKLMKTNEYQFRVSAVNKFGVSRPLESAPVIAQMQYSKIINYL